MTTTPDEALRQFGHAGRHVADAEAALAGKPQRDRYLAAWAIRELDWAGVDTGEARALRERAERVLRQTAPELVLS